MIFEVAIYVKFSFRFERNIKDWTETRGGRFSCQIPSLVVENNYATQTHQYLNTLTSLHLD